MIRVAYVSTYVPQKCGLATYTHHLRQAVRGARGWRGMDPVIAMKPTGGTTGYADPVIAELAKDDRSAYAKMAERLNRSDVSVVSLQHEFGIFGGEAGEYVLDLIEPLRKPLAVTFHTVFENPQEPYRSVQMRIARRAEMILVMNRKAGEMLHRAFGIPLGKIQYVPHGTPEPVPGKRKAFRESMQWEGRKVILSFGLLGRGKGLETVIQAMPDVVRQVPEALYAIVGQTHPEVLKFEGEAYREELQAMIRKLGLEEHVRMLDRYMEEDELVGLLSACDLYVTPYPGLQQITSGTLAYAVGLGRPVLSTPYAYAADLLAAYPEWLLPSEEPAKWASAITEILADDRKWKRMEKEMARIGSGMHWPQVGRLHLDLFSELAGKVPALQANG